MYKQVMVVRSDLGMSAGKIAAQVAHASIESWKNASDKMRNAWKNEGSKKVILKVGGEMELRNLYETAKKLKISAALIRDAGATEIPAGTMTCVGFGPDEETKIDRVTGSLPLLD